MGSVSVFLAIIDSHSIHNRAKRVIFITRLSTEST